MSDCEKAAMMLRFLLSPDGGEIRANGDGTVTLPAWAAVKLADVIAGSAYL